MLKLLLFTTIFLPLCADEEEPEEEKSYTVKIMEREDGKLYLKFPEFYKYGYKFILVIDEFHLEDLENIEDED